MHRGIEPELAGIAAALHDMGMVMTKRDERHAQAAEKYVYDFLERYNSEPGTKLRPVTKVEVERIIKAIVKHSEKGVYSNDPLVEVLKDVDS